MILVREIEKFDDLVDYILIFAELKLINRKDLEEKAKQIDKEKYSKECFRVEYVFDKKTNKLSISENGIYYVDNNGVRHFLDKNINRFDLSNIKNSIALELSKYLEKN